MIHIDPSGHMHTEIGVTYTSQDKSLIKSYQSLFKLGSSTNNPYIMQAAHDSANLIRLKYLNQVNRTSYIDYYSGNPSKNRATQSYTASMHNELINGNASQVPLGSVLLNTVGIIAGPGEAKIAYTITKEATEAVLKQWGKTTGKKAEEAFSKSASKGYVNEFGANGVKNINPFIKNGNSYSLEIKVKNKQFESYRIYGRKTEDGNIIFDLFGPHL
ncbi:hypothetical protein JNUCC31_08240 [Paenibacillus sp. JNUCC31]|nr:hypothetical protein JNUCC31_08240 [Paenibacillus sp. JNUCC-31]